MSQDSPTRRSAARQRPESTGTSAETVTGPIGSAQGSRAAVTTFTAGATLGLLVLLDVTYVLNAMDRQVFPVLVPAVRTAFGFSLGQGGLLATIFTLGIGVIGLPAGLLIDRFPRKRIILVGIATFSIFTLLQAVSTGFADMAIYRILSGAGEGLQNAALFAALGAFYQSRRGLALGTLNFSYGLGGFLGPFIGARLLTATGAWQTSFWLYGGIGVLLFLAVLFLVPHQFTERSTTDPAVKATAGEVSSLKSRNVAACAVAALIIGFCTYSYLGLYPTYLKAVLGFNTNQAGLAASMFGIGAMAGIPAGWLGDRYSTRAVNIIALLGSMLSGGLLFNINGGIATQTALSFLEGAFASGFLYTNTYSLIQRSAPSGAIGKASGLFVASLYIPAAVSGYVFAAEKNAFGWGGAAILQLVCVPILGIVAMALLDRSRVRGETRQPSLSPEASR